MQTSYTDQINSGPVIFWTFINCNGASSAELLGNSGYFKRRGYRISRMPCDSQFAMIFLPKRKENLHF